MTRWALLIGAALLLPDPARADTLRDAIAAAWATSPDLAEARARQEAVAQLPQQARAEGRPTLFVEGQAGHDRFGFGNSGSANVLVDLPVWTGGRVPASVRAADAVVAAGEQRLRDREAAVIERVVIAYADVLFAQQSAEVARIGIDRLDRQVAEAQSRFDLGQATSTDIAQLQAQRATVIANLADADAALASAAATYRAVVGDTPDDLQPEATPPGTLPPDLDAARALALAANPLLLEQQRVSDAAAARIDRERAERAPLLALGGGYGRGAELAAGDLRGFESAATVGLSLRIPLLTGGLVPARVREAEATCRAERFAAASVERETIRSVDSAWAALAAARQRLSASADGLAAAELALNGVRAEYEFGLRSTIDILLAEQSLRGAQLALARSRSDLLVTHAALLRASGLLDAAAYL